MNQLGPIVQDTPRTRPRGIKPLLATPGLDPLVKAALDSSPVGLVVLYPDQTVRMVTEGAADLLGLPAGRTLRLPVLRLLAGCKGVDAQAMRLIAAALEDAGQEAQEVLLTLKTPTATRLVAMDVRAAGESGWVLSLSDVTRTRQAQAWLLEHVSSDPVTGLWNRPHLMLMLQDSLARAAEDPVLPAPAVLVIGLHRLKHVTETLGLGCADMLLRMAGDRLSMLLGEDDMLAHFARDEFAISLARPGDRASIAVVAAAICEILGRPYVIDGQLVVSGAHAGIACAPDDGNTPEQLTTHASLALQAARGGAATTLCFFDPGLTERAHQRRELEIDLRQALQLAEFELYFQPQVDLYSNSVTGLEALIRWRNPRRGMVPPIEFIYLAEQNGLIGDIGDWVLHEACRHAALWPAEVTVAVNASPLQFETGHFARSVAEALVASGLPASRLEIEVTESLLLRDTGAVLQTLAALRAQGVRLVLDDFGTGYASLSQLSRFRFDKIKIDRSFVSMGEATPENSAIVRAIATLGHSLNIPTTAEGVETETQLAQIKADGCTCVQGYYFSRPVPAGEVAQLLRRSL